ncbi:MAG: hypothetical protein BWY45_03048 [Euryarchaeota archaeon ADurb.Bin294]|nr:MAG: hypothetical protein BWY45_03048 [Euryarchaeota archaeon ADurb.Bin294]
MDEFLKDQGSDIFRGKFVSAHIFFIICSHFTFDGTDNFLRINYLVMLGLLSDRKILLIFKIHNRGCDSSAQVILNYHRFIKQHICHLGVCCPKIDPDYVLIHF